MFEPPYKLKWFRTDNFLCFADSEARLIILILVFLCLNASLNILNKV